MNENVPRAPRIRVLNVVVLLLISAITIPPVILALLLMAVAETAQSRMFALTLISFFGAGVSLLWTLKARRRSWISRLFGGIALCLVTTFYWMTPKAQPTGVSRAQSVFLAPSSGVLSLTGLVPEIDQVKMGMLFIPWIDRFMTTDKTRRLRDLFLDCYRPMRGDPEFQGLTSAMGAAYADALGIGFSQGHMFVYLPAHGPSERLPVLLFLHGSYGNFQAYLWVWKKFADENRVAIVAPSFGFGIWSRPAGISALDAAYTYCAKHPNLNATNMVLVGLSNGGLGVSREGLEHPNRYRGLVYISGVIEESIVCSSSFSRAWRGRSVLVMHGERDERIPYRLIASISEKIEESGILVTERFYPTEDHFLLLAQQDECRGDVARWWNSIERDERFAEGSRKH